MYESCAGALGIPEFMPPNRRRTFKENLHAPAKERTTMYESCAGAFGIPEFMSPNRRQTFKEKNGYKLPPVGNVICKRMWEAGNGIHMESNI